MRLKVIAGINRLNLVIPLLIFNIFCQRLTWLILDKILKSILSNLVSKLFWKILDVHSILRKITGQNESLLKLKLVVLFINAVILFVLASQQSIEGRYL